MIDDEYHIKHYLSYSQFKLFRQNPERYRKVYLFGFKFHNKYTDFGSAIHKALEKRTGITRDEQLAIKSLPRTQIGEVEIETRFGGVPLFGKLDGLNVYQKKGEVFLDVIEYKTGKNAWTQRRVDNNEQLSFYSILAPHALKAVLTAKGKKIPIENIKFKLIWIETFEDIDGALHLTGRTESFVTTRTREDTRKLKPQLQEVWHGIGQMINESIKGRSQLIN